MSGGGGFVHVDDAAEMHVAALEHGESGASYIANASYLEVERAVRAIVGASRCEAARDDASRMAHAATGCGG